MTTLPRYDAVMVTLGNRDLDTGGLAARCAAFFDDMGEMAGAPQTLSATHSVVATHSYATAIKQFHAGSLEAANLPENGYDGPINVIQITLIAHNPEAHVAQGVLKETATRLLAALALRETPDYVVLPGTRRLVHADVLHPERPSHPAFAPIATAEARLMGKAQDLDATKQSSTTSVSRPGATTGRFAPLAMLASILSVLPY